MMFEAVPVWICVTGNDRLVKGIDVARDDGLHGLHHGHHGHHRIDTFMRSGPVAPLAGQIDKGRINRGHQRARRGLEMPEGQVWRVVDAENLTDLEAVHHAFLHHDLTAAAVFLGGLEDQRDAARKAARLGQIFRGPQKHGHMAVMPAGVHLARNGRGVFHPVISAIGSASISARSPMALPGPTS